MSFLRLYSVAMTFAIFAVLWSVGLHSDRLVGALLAIGGVCVIVAEKERQRLVRKRRGGYRRRRGDG